ncbi:MAG: SDR family NAD(P)-dependent oxidoreductase, partial [Myxococcota bacterium]|nr:SDR family NAD(P)-dependent oxidoreductase [Myxococcota bacterium]
MNLTGKNALISGATSGIGRETAMALAKMGAHVCLIGRNQNKTENLCATIMEAQPEAQVSFLLADLSSQNDILKLADRFKTEHQCLDILVNNAGALLAKRDESVEGFEYTWALNHLNYFLLTTLLQDQLRAAPEARVVSVASAAH